MNLTLTRNQSDMSRTKYPLPDIGQRFGDWTVINNDVTSEKSKRYGKYVTVRCVCGKTKDARVSSLVRQETTKCVSCAAKQRSKAYFKGEGEMSQSFYYHLQKGAESRGLDFTITSKFLWDLFIKQERKCALSGVELEFYTHYKNKTDQTASVDRIDSSKGYIEGNVQWVHKHVNLMKLNFSQETFINLCELIASHKKAVPRISIIAKTKVEGIHRWFKCPIEEVSYLRNYHRHVFYIEARAYVNHADRDIEFIKLSHDITTYLTEKYYSDQYKCLFFDDRSCEMIGDELVKKFNLHECQVTEDFEGGSIVRNI